MRLAWLIPLVLLGCSSPRQTAPQLVAPVRASIARVGDKVSSAKAHAEKIKTTIDTNPVEAKVEVDALLRDLEDALRWLNEANGKVDNLEKLVGPIIYERDEAIRQLGIVERRYGKLKFALCSLAAAAGVYLLMRFKWVLALLGPWSWVAYVAGPSVLFGMFWVLIDWLL